MRKYLPTTNSIDKFIIYVTQKSFRGKIDKRRSIFNSVSLICYGDCQAYRIISIFVLKLSPTIYYYQLRNHLNIAQYFGILLIISEFKLLK